VQYIHLLSYSQTIWQYIHVLMINMHVYNCIEYISYLVYIYIVYIMYIVHYIHSTVYHMHSILYTWYNIHIYIGILYYSIYIQYIIYSVMYQSNIHNCWWVMRKKALVGYRCISGTKMDRPPTARAALRLAGTSPCGKAKGHKKKVF